MKKQQISLELITAAQMVVIKEETSANTIKRLVNLNVAKHFILPIIEKFNDLEKRVLHKLAFNFAKNKKFSEKDKIRIEHLMKYFAEMSVDLGRKRSNIYYVNDYLKLEAGSNMFEVFPFRYRGKYSRYRGYEYHIYYSVLFSCKERKVLFKLPNMPKHIIVAIPEEWEEAKAFLNQTFEKIIKKYGQITS